MSPRTRAVLSTALSTAIFLIGSILSGCAAVVQTSALTSSLGSNSTVTSITISPGSASTTVGGTAQFVATVQGTNTNKSVTWKVSAGSISASGSYKAPTTAGTATLIATSNADSSKTATATISVFAATPPTAPSATNEAPTISTLSAAPASIQLGQSSTIGWSVTGATSLNLSGVGAVAGNSYTATPSQTTTYTLVAKNAVGSTSRTVTVTVSDRVPTNAQQLFTTGVVTHFGQDKGNVEANTNLIQEMGATTIRDEIYWKEVEHSRGSYALPSIANTWVNIALSKGLKPLITLDYGNPLYDNGDKPTSSTAIEAFAAYAEFVATQFKGRVVMYEIWNEWDLTTGNTTAGTPQSYVNLLKVVYPRLKAVDPNIVVVGGGISAGAILSPWFGEMLDAGALKSADAISIHEYIFHSTGAKRSPETLISKLAGVEATLQSRNGGKTFPLYLTETGWPTNTGTAGTTEAEAGDFNAETALLLPSVAGLKGIYWYDFQDDGSVATDPEANFGLVHVNLNPKPGYFALTDARNWMAGAQFTARISTSDPAVDGVKFTLADGSEAMALWRIGAGTSNVEVTGGETMESINQTTATTTTFKVKSPVLQDLTESPVWFVGTGLKVQ